MERNGATCAVTVHSQQSASVCNSREKKAQAYIWITSEYCDAALRVTRALPSNHLKIPQYYSSKQETELHLPFDQLSSFICLARGVHAGSCLKYHLRRIIKNILLICPFQTALHQQSSREVCLQSLMSTTQAPATQKY